MKTAYSMPKRVNALFQKMFALIIPVFTGIIHTLHFFMLQIEIDLFQNWPFNGIFWDCGMDSHDLFLYGYLQFNVAIFLRLSYLFK